MKLYLIADVHVYKGNRRRVTGEWVMSHISQVERNKKTNEKLYLIADVHVHKGNRWREIGSPSAALHEHVLRNQMDSALVITPC